MGDNQQWHLTFPVVSPDIFTIKLTTRWFESGTLQVNDISIYERGAFWGVNKNSAVLTRL